MTERRICWDDIALVLCVTFMAVLFSGSPDLLDAIINYVNAKAACK